MSPLDSRSWGRWAGHLFRRSRGQSLIELGLILPVLLIMLLGLMDLGRAFVIGIAVQGGVMEAARLASVQFADKSLTTTNQAIYTRLVNASAPALAGCTVPATPALSMTCTDSAGSTWTLSITYTPSTVASGVNVEVKATANVSLSTGFQTGAFGLQLGGIPVQGDAQAVVI